MRSTVRRSLGIGITGLWIVVALSGCVEGEAGTAGNGTAGEVPDAAEPATFDEDSGAISGVVTDDQLQPLAGAQVGLIELPDKVTVTDKAGAFTLSNLDPGTYQLFSQMLGFESAGRKVDVSAAQVTSVQFALVKFAVVEPYIELFLKKGYLNCAFAIIRTTLAATCNPNTPTTSTHDVYTKGWPTTFKAVMIEADWNSQANPDWLAFDFNDRGIGYFGVYYRFRGTSPMAFLVERCGDYTKTAFGRAPVPCDDDAVSSSKMHIETFYVGKFQQETHTADPVCRENLTAGPAGNVLPGYQQGCYGVGVATELRWTNYVSVFHLEVPQDVASYSARPDR